MDESTNSLRQAFDGRFSGAFTQVLNSMYPESSEDELDRILLEMLSLFSRTSSSNPNDSSEFQRTVIGSPEIPEDYSGYRTNQLRNVDFSGLSGGTALRAIEASGMATLLRLALDEGLMGKTSYGSGGGR